MVLPWRFRCLLFVVPLVEAARPVVVQKECPERSRPSKNSKGCECWGGYVCNDNCRAPGLRFVGFKGEEPEGCECMHADDFALLGKFPVQVAAIHFCESAVREARHFYFEGEGMIEDWEQDHRFGAIELCQGLVANASKQVDPMNPWQSEAQRSRKGPDGFGRLERVEKKARPEDREVWEEALKHVCHDECVELVNETMEEMKEMAEDDVPKGISPTRSCATRVVQKVEAETFTCCARTCGWNNATCLSWPFLTNTQQIEWQAECCSEWNVLKGSSRERLCNSVMSPTDEAKVSQNDLPEPPNIDTSAVVIGQDANLVWTEKGLKSDLAKAYESMDPPPEVGKPVQMLILCKVLARFSFYPNLLSLVSGTNRC